LLSVRPNADQTPTVYWEGMVAAALLSGNAFAEKRTVGGRVVSLVPLHPERVAWRRSPAGSYVFDYIDDDGRPREIPETNVFHLPGFTLQSRWGMSAIRYGMEMYGAALAANGAAARTFKSGLLPTVYYSMDRVLTKEQRTQFRENLRELTGAMNAGKSPLLEGGMKAGTIGINPSDAQLLESRSFSIEEICRWFGVPAVMLSAGDKASSWASSAESLNRWFLQYGLRPLLKRIEQEIAKSLFTAEEALRYYAEFAVEGLLRADTAGRSAFYSTALQNGYMSRNEVRRLENLPPIDGGDVYTVQVNLMPLDRIGEEPGVGENG
jgi:HK97 family phage portal protein